MNIENKEQLVIHLHNGTKSYGWGANTKTVFKHLNIQIPKGSIYGLLGPSGCGKTTLLNCIVGLDQLDSGDIWVLGGKPGTPYSGVPGSRIGYMPQNVALINEFTVKDIIYYYGRIYKLNIKKLKIKLKFLSELLHLPPNCQQINTCSGGQQRRISLAVALIHEPELLILDEPTVGLDPILNDIIWNHFVHITRTLQQSTILLTTHYIEETKQADLIGLMRNGSLLCQESPEALLSQLHVDTLEEVFLKLSQEQNKHISNNQQLKQLPVNSPLKAEQNNKNIVSNKFDLQKFYALINKYYLLIIKNYPGVAILILLPTIMITTEILAIGTNPKIINLGFVNYEMSEENCSKYSVIKYNNDNNTCQMLFLSCFFIQSMNIPNLKKIFYNTEETAKIDVQKGNTVGFLHFRYNFTDSLIERMESKTEDINIENSEVDITLDMTSLFGILLKRNVFNLFFQFTEELRKACNRTTNPYKFPFQFSNVYGSMNQELNVYSNPAFITIIVHFMAVLSTGTTIFTERNDGTWHRNLVAGITYNEILSAHFIVQFIVLVFVTIETMLLNNLFKMEIMGDLHVLFIVLLLQGVVGMLIGFIISIVATSFTSGCGIGVGYFFSCIFNSGTLWPIEGASKILYHLRYLSPLTLPASAVRSIFNRGWNFENNDVYTCVISCFIWIIILTFLSFALIKVKK